MIDSTKAPTAQSVDRHCGVERTEVASDFISTYIPLDVFRFASMNKLDKNSAKLLKVDELKAALKARRSSTGGKKSDLYERLVACLDSESLLDGDENTEKKCDGVEIFTDTAPIKEEINVGERKIAGEVTPHSSYRII